MRYGYFFALDNLDTVVQNGSYAGSGEMAAKTIEGQGITIPYDTFRSTVDAGGDRYVVEFTVTESPSGGNAVHSVEIAKAPETQLRALYDQYMNAGAGNQNVETSGAKGYNGNQAGDGNAYQRMLDEVEQAKKLGMTAREYAMSRGVPSSLSDAEAASLDLYDLKGVNDDAGDAAQADETNELIQKITDDWNGLRRRSYHADEGSWDRADLLNQNREQGRAYEQKSFTEFSKNYLHAQEQITVKTPSRIKTRLDAIGLDAEGNVVINEFKSSATAPLTPNQKTAFPEIFESGGMVVGRGKGIFSGGYTIPTGTDIKIIRPPK